MSSTCTCFRSALLAGAWALLASGCGGGVADGGALPPLGDEIYISSPSSFGTSQTDRASVAIAGGASPPQGSSCPAFTGTLPPGYQVSWANSATGGSGTASSFLNCFLFVYVAWSASDIALAMGDNPITVTETGGGRSAQARITVVRVPDTTPPAVESTSPTPGAAGVPVNAVIVATFNEAMAPASLSGATIALKDSADNPVAATVTYVPSSFTARLTPASPLAFSSSYRATVTTGVTDASGNALPAPYEIAFSTAANPDATPPTVQSVSPVDGAACAPTAGSVTASFSEALDPGTINGNTFSVTGPGGLAVAGSVAYLDRVASFTPATALAHASTYTAALATGIADLAGNATAAPYQWSFTTLAAGSAGSWAPTSLGSAPYPRSGHVAVWTGNEMIVAAGLAYDTDFSRFDYTSQYGRYDPATGQWTRATGAPTGVRKVAAWTGSRMLVWGGYQAGQALSGGAAFDPSTNTWAVIATANQPSARIDQASAWTGSELVIWGGRSGNGSSVFGNGARYDPASDSWQAMSTLGAPSARYGHTAVWTGTELIVWGGIGATASALADGARYDPTTDTWTAISGVNVPSARYGHVAVWTGSRMIIWGSASIGTDSGGLYDPATDRWTSTNAACAPAARSWAPAIWTGTRMVIWGGVTGSSYLADGYEYDPVGNTWLKLTATGAPSARAEHTAVWTGTRSIIWGGSDGGVTNTGALLAP
jgi:N-acetylneuraminic acid mutarotase